MVEDVEEILVRAVAERSGDRRVPQPSICQNFVFDRSILKNTRFPTCGMSRPVSGHIASNRIVTSDWLDQWLRAAMEWLGHSQVSQTMRYTHVAPEVSKDTAQRLGDTLFGA
mgnify:CR=1 FL=1